MQWRGRPSSRGAWAIAVVLAATFTGCDDGDDDATSTTSASDVSAPSSARPSDPIADEPAITTSPPSSPSSPVTVGETIATVPEQAAPGIDSEDPFCRAWSEFAGSFQALTFASIADSDPLVGARLEVLAAGAVAGAAQTLDDTFPDEIVGERERFVDDVIGPFARRAGRAVDALRSAGLGADVEVLGQVWLAALVDADLTDPVIAVEVPAALDGAVDEATRSFAAAFPPIAADPSLVTEAEAPDTLAYLAEQCPDQGVLAGNDAIG